MPALGRQKQVDLCEFETSLVYRGSSRTAQRNPVLKNKQTKLKLLMYPAYNEASLLVELETDPGPAHAK